MKFKNWLMSKILHPSAYLVWHALGNPKEWESSDGDKLRTIRHIPSGVQFWTGNGGAFFDGYGSEWEHCIGYFDRHLVWPRVRKIRRAMKKRSAKRHKLFMLMSQMEKG